MADEHKAKGNAAFSSGNFQEAITHYSAGIAVDGSNHVLYSNRSACQAKVGNWDSALNDALKCVELKPDFVKGYSRLGGAYHGLRNYTEASTAYRKGLELDPSNQACKTGLEETENEFAGGSKPSAPGSKGLFGPDFIAKLAMNPETRGYLEQPDFQKILQDLGSNPQNMTQHLMDPRLQKAMEVGMGISLGGMGGAPGGMGGMGASSMNAEPKESKPPAPAPEPEPVVEVEMTEEEKAEADLKEKALAEKAAGAAAYKAKDFDKAITHFTAAWDIYDKDLSFLTNRAAAHFEKGDYDSVITDCTTAVEKGRAIMPIDWKMIARAMTRHGNALVKQGKLEEAITMFNRALTEHRNPESLKALQAAEKQLKEDTEKAYVDFDLAEEAKNEGNDAFKAADYPKAIERYSEALKRGPPGQWEEAYKCFSNRAACYTKLGAMPEGEKDADKCIELKPDFAKGYSRKAHVQFFMKEYEKAMETYQKGLEFDPQNQELKDGIQRCQQSINKFMTGTASEDEIKERQAKAMSDPEIQNIMVDPVMQQVLKECQETPGALSNHLRDPGIASKLQKLMGAGIIRMS